MKLMLEVSEAKVLTRDGSTDLIYLVTDKPYPFKAFDTANQQRLEVRIETPMGYGVEYCRQVFGVNPKVIDAS